VSQFIRMIIFDVISDPNDYIVNELNDKNNKKLEYWKDVLQISNIKYAKSLPRNTIIAKELRDNNSNLMFVFPFFPSHLSFPCKPGEMVWAIKENPDSITTDLAYWFCKITEPHFIDDVNHTHAPRINETSMFPGITKISEDLEPWYELRNGRTFIVENIRKTDINGMYTSQGYPSGSKRAEQVFEDLVTETDASKIIDYEAVPRFRKRPGDISIEGSNNSLIVLGTDRTGPVSNYIKADNRQKPEKNKKDLNKSAGSIDLVVGRGQTEKTSAKIVSVTSMQLSNSESRGKELHKEIGKSNKDIVAFEGDPDLKEDRSRVLISQRTKTDLNFGLEDYNKSFKDKGHDISDSKSGDAAIVIKTDKIRIIARSDVEIIVTGNDVKKSPDGQDIKSQKDDHDDWASIVVATDGSIIFKPSKKGYIKLGSENASKALLCTDKDAIASNGNVSSPPVADTMGGFIGTSEAGQGTWAKKILVD